MREWRPTTRLTADMVLRAYAVGAFPMGEPDTPYVEWYSADPRGVIPIGAFHASRSLRRCIRRGEYDVRCDTAFEAVMRGCARPRPGQPRTWINEPIVRAYLDLHRAGLAHSVEAWHGEVLVGGVYGVGLRGAFFAESMFTRFDLDATDASKVCLAHLAAHLRLRGYRLLDTQMWNPHIAQFGCVAIPHEEYLRRLAGSLACAEVTWGEFDAQAARNAILSMAG